MKTDDHVIERHFDIPEGLLSKISNDKTYRIFFDITKKYFHDFVINEQSKIQLDDSLKENLSLKNSLSSLEKDYEDLRNQNERQNEISKKLEEARQVNMTKNDENYRLNQNIRELNFQREIKEQEFKDLELKHSKLLQNLDIKENHIISLNDELSETVKRWQKTNIECKGLICEVETLKERLESQKSSPFTKFNISDKIREMQKELNLTIEDYSEKLLLKDRDLDNMKLELQCRDKKIEYLSVENSQLKNNRLNLQFRCDELHKKVYTVESDLRTQLSSAERRVNVIEQYCNSQHQTSIDISNKLTEYISFIDKLKKQLHESEKDKNSLITELNSCKEQSIKINAESERRLDLAQKEIWFLKSQSYKKSNERIPEEVMLDKELLERLSSTAVETSKCVASGYTLTDIHTEYFKQHDENTRLLDENKQAAKKISELLNSQNEYKKSLFESEKECRGLIEANSRLSKRLNDARAEILSLNSRLRDEKNKNSELEFDIKKAIQLKIDLCSQISALTTKNELLRQFVSKDDLTNIENENNLPLFSSVTELQAVNCRLLETLHDLEAEIENLNREPTKVTTVEESNSTQIEFKDKEISILSKSLEITSYQRDMYKILYHQKGGCHVTNDELSALHNHSIASENIYLDADRAKARITELERELDNKSCECIVIREQSAREISLLKENAHAAQSSIQTNESKLNHLKEKCKQLKNTNDALFKKSLAQDEYMISMENRIDDLIKKNRQCESELGSIRVFRQSLASECENLKQVIRNLEIENQFMRDERAKANPLVLQLRELSSQLTFIESKSHSKLPSQIEIIREEITQFKFQLSALSSEFSAEKLSISQKIEKLKKAYTDEKNSHIATQKKLDDLQKEITQLSQNDLTKSSQENDFQLERFRAIAESAESRLSELQISHENLTQTLHNERESFKLQLNAYESQIEELKQHSVTDIQPSNNSDIRVSQLEDENIILKDQKNSLSVQLDASIVTHSDTIKRLNELSLYHQTSELKLNDLMNKISSLEQQLGNERQKSKSLQTEIENLILSKQEDCMAYKKESELLYHQINDLRGKLSSIQPDTSLKDNQQQPDLINSDLWKLLEFIRNDKALIQARFENSQLENARLSTRCTELRDTIEDLEKTLQTERNVQRFSPVKYEQTDLYELQLEKKQIEDKLIKSSNLIENLNKKLNSLTTQLEDVKEQLSSTTKLYEDQFSRNDVLKRQIEAANRNISTLKERLMIKKNDESNENQIKDISERLAKTERSLDEYKHKESSHLNLISKLNEQIKAMKKVIETKKQEIKELQQLLSNHEKNQSVEKFDKDNYGSTVSSSQSFLPQQETSIMGLESHPLVESGIKKPISIETDIPKPGGTSMITTHQIFAKPIPEVKSKPSSSIIPKPDVKIMFSSGTNVTVPSGTTSRFTLSRNIIQVDDLFKNKLSTTETSQEKSSSTFIESTAVSKDTDISDQIHPHKRTVQISLNESNVDDVSTLDSIVEEPAKKFCEHPPPSQSLDLSIEQKQQQDKDDPLDINEQREPGEIQLIDDPTSENLQLQVEDNNNLRDDQSPDMPMEIPVIVVTNIDGVNHFDD